MCALTVRAVGRGSGTARRSAPVRIVSTSSWQRGRCWPERSHSLQALQALEEILAIPGNTLVTFAGDTIKGDGASPLCLTSLPGPHERRTVLDGAVQLAFSRGEVAGPEGRSAVDLPMARQTVEIREMLEEKTQGNLTGEEERILSQVLADLQAEYERKSAAR